MVISLSGRGLYHHIQKRRSYYSIRPTVSQDIVVEATSAMVLKWDMYSKGPRQCGWYCTLGEDEFTARRGQLFS